MVQTLLQDQVRINKNKIKLVIIGLGYVGLPLALEFGKNEMLVDLILIREELEN